MKAIASTILSLCLVSGTAFAAGDPGGSSVPAAPKDPVMEKVAAATRNQDWPAAQAVLKEALAKSPQNPDYHNLYAYTVRKGPNPDMSLVFQHYNQALAIDPKHKQAHEYLGEAYLMVGNVAKAKEHLAQLDKICFLPCSEYSDLKKAIADYEKKTASR
ncbi:MAG TPA: tetratricopeptide repeat protein [Burkholderiales bacterium]|jgi:tetratricopeptide (TPR) repeat protein